MTTFLKSGDRGQPTQREALADSFVDGSVQGLRGAAAVLGGRPYLGDGDELDHAPLRGDGGRRNRTALLDQLYGEVDCSRLPAQGRPDTNSTTFEEDYPLLSSW
ncbi:hypothetical protein ACWDBW_38310 [Streptomyces sp. NPDC001107]